MTDIFELFCIGQENDDPDLAKTIADKLSEYTGKVVRVTTPSQKGVSRFLVWDGIHSYPFNRTYNSREVKKSMPKWIVEALEWAGNSIDNAQEQEPAGKTP